MKKTVLFLTIIIAFGVKLTAYAQEESRIVNELKLSGDLKMASQLDLGAPGSGHFGLKKAELGFEYQFTQYSGMMFQLHLSGDLEGSFGGRYLGKKFDKDGSTVTTDQFYGYTDFLGEAGVNQLIGLGFKIGKFDDQSEYLVKHHALNFGFSTGDSLRQDRVNEPLNIRWDIPINALSEIMPLRFWVIHDADFSRSNNDVSVAVHAESQGMRIAERVALDWNVYYNYQGAGRTVGVMKEITNPDYQGKTGSNDDPNHHPELVKRFTESDDGICIARHRVGGSLGTTIMLADSMRLGFGAMMDYARDTVARSYIKKESGGAVLAEVTKMAQMTSAAEGYQDYLTYAVGMRFTMDNLFRMNLAYQSRARFNAPSLPNRYDQQVLASRFDLLLVPNTVFYAGMSVDLRSNEALLEHFGVAKLRGHERLGVDVGVAYKVLRNVNICVGYFWGNMHNGGLEAPTFRKNMGSFENIGGVSRNKIGHALYFKTKFAI